MGWKKGTIASVFAMLAMASLAAPGIACLSITEVHPTANEWVEILSSCENGTNISGYVLTDNVSGTFQLSGEASNGEYLIAADNAAQFSAEFNTTARVIDLEYGSNWLNDGGDDVYITLNGSLIESLHYTKTERGVSWQLCGSTWEKAPEPTPGAPGECTPEEENGSARITEFFAEPSEIEECDPVNFHYTVHNTMTENSSFNSTVSIGGEVIRCAEASAAPGGNFSGNCTWRAPCEMQPGETRMLATLDIRASGELLGESQLYVTARGPDDMGEFTLEVPAEQGTARFGEFRNVMASMYTGNMDLPIRIVTYIYSPRWITDDLDGETIHTNLNETKASIVVQETGRGEKLVLGLPIFIKPDCDGEYDDGIYTGRVRVYEESTGNVVAEERFNITVSGRNGMMCMECEDCDCQDCGDSSCSSFQTPPATTDDQRKGYMMEVTKSAATAEAGSEIETVVTVSNRLGRGAEFSIYSYAYSGSKCITLGRDNGTLKRTWTANTETFSLEPGQSTDKVLSNVVWDDAEPGTYDLRVRLRYGDSKEDITLSLNVTPENKSAPNATSAARLDANITTELQDEEEEIQTHRPAESAVGMAASEETSAMQIFSWIYESLYSWLISFLNVNDS